MVSEALFAPCDEGLGKHAVQVYYDSPAATDSLSAVIGSLGLTMRFQGSIARVPTSLLMDSWSLASHMPMQPEPITMICLHFLFIAPMTADTPGNSSSAIADSSKTALVDSAGLLSAFPEPN